MTLTLFIKKNIIHLDQGGGICYIYKKKDLVRENECENKVLHDSI